MMEQIHCSGRRRKLRSFAGPNVELLSDLGQVTSSLQASSPCFWSVEVTLLHQFVEPSHLGPCNPQGKLSASS